MAIAQWKDFQNKYGFRDGATVEKRDFRARDRLCQILNALPEMKGVLAVGYDRPGVHNPCLIIPFDRRPDLTKPEAYIEAWNKDEIDARGDVPPSVYDHYMMSDLVEAAYGRMALRELIPLTLRDGRRR